jgi:hypothetical protein
MVQLELKNIMILLFGVILISIIIMNSVFKNIQEHMSDIPKLPEINAKKKYIPLHERNQQTDIIPTPPLMPTPHRFTSYDDYVKFQQILRDKNMDVPSDPPEEGANVVKDINWRIHRWSLWDYIPDIQNANTYWCRSQQHDGAERCIPLSKKQYCRQGYLYNDASKCLLSIKKSSSKKDVLNMNYSINPYN